MDRKGIKKIKKKLIRSCKKIIALLNDSEYVETAQTMTDLVENLTEKTPLGLPISVIIAFIKSVSNVALEYQIKHLLRGLGTGYNIEEQLNLLQEYVNNEKKGILGRRYLTKGCINQFTKGM